MSYILSQPGVVWQRLLEHLAITLSALAIAILIALPLSLVIRRFRVLAAPILVLLGVLYTIPSIALMILLLPVFGLNARTVVVSLVVYSQVILVRNILAGLQGISPAILEAARGMGMNGWQRWWRVEFPLALPVMLAGVRLAAVVSVGIATLGAKFSAGGLGSLLFDGIAQAGRYDKIWAGAITVGLLALALNQLFLWAERWADRGRQSQSPR